MKKKLIIVCGLVFIGMTLIIEISVRKIGLVEFPLYEADRNIGYIIAPNQKGRFLKRNDWIFNEYHMGCDKFTPSVSNDMLLIGDSIVLGGNPYKQHEKLGPQLKIKSPASVWPIAAGSWSLVNELRYIRYHPEVRNSIDSFVFIENSGDFGSPSSWANEITHPIEHPNVATAYLFKKYVWNWEPKAVVSADLHVTTAGWQSEWKEFEQSVKKREAAPKIFIYLYPTKAEYEAYKADAKSKLANYADQLSAVCSKNVKIYDVSRDSRWDIGYYKDSIHPTVDGNAVLSTIISSPEEQNLMMGNCD